MKHKYKEALMDMAERFGKTSTAKRLKVGCLIYKNDSIVSLGVNGQPPNWHTEDCEGSDGLTLPTVRHAEQAALDKLVTSTETSVGATMFVSHQPCLACSIRIVSAKISTVYYRHQYRSDEGVRYLMENNVEVHEI